MKEQKREYIGIKAKEKRNYIDFFMKPIKSIMLLNKIIIFHLNTLKQQQQKKLK